MAGLKETLETFIDKSDKRYEESNKIDNDRHLEVMNRITELRVIKDYHKELIDKNEENIKQLQLKKDFSIGNLLVKLITGLATFWK